MFHGHKPWFLGPLAGEVLPGMKSCDAYGRSKANLYYCINTAAALRRRGCAATDGPWKHVHGFHGWLDGNWRTEVARQTLSVHCT